MYMTAEKRYIQATWKIMEQLLEVDSIGDVLSGSLEIIYNILNSEAGAIWLLDKTTDRLAPCSILASRIFPASLWKTGWA